VPALSNVVVEQAIVHALFPGSNPLLSDVPLAFDGSDASSTIQTLLAMHVANAWADPASRAANFDEPAANVAYKHSKGLFDDSKTLVKNSQALARELADCMRTHPRITPGNLVVCLCVAEQSRYLALLKLDVANVLQRRIDELRQGRRRISLVVVDNVLPTRREKLQKAAIIRQLTPEPDFHMRLIDKQDGQDVAKFFQERFLRARFAFNNKDLTRALYQTALKTGRRMAEEQIVSAVENRALADYVAYTLAQASFDLDQWLPGAPINPRARERLGNALRQELEDRTFGIDHPAAESLTAFRFYEDGQGLRLRVPETMLRTGDFSLTHENGQDIIRITTRGVVELANTRRTREQADN
jgi:hypothetical protein